TNTCTQIISWTRDTTAPTFTICPVSKNLGCNPAIIPDCDLSPTNVAATDDCGVTNITCSRMDTTNGCVHTRTLTYTAVDGCNNTRSCIQAITWREDITPPVFTLCPTNMDLGANPPSGSIPV